MGMYRKKPVVIEAIQLENTDASIHMVLEFIGQTVNNQSNMAMDRFCDYCDIVKKSGMLLKTLESGEGTQIASIGDYIIKGIQGEFYPCKPDIFNDTYEKVE